MHQCHVVGFIQIMEQTALTAHLPRETRIITYCHLHAVTGFNINSTNSTTKATYGNLVKPPVRHRHEAHRTYIAR